MDRGKIPPVFYLLLITINNYIYINQLRFLAMLNLFEKIDIKKTLAGSLALFGVGAIAAMEIALTPDMSWGLGIAVVFAGLARWYMFYEGSALSEFGTEGAKQDGEIAFWISVSLAVSFVGYGVFLFIIKAIQAHAFGLFLTANFALISIEWVFAKRSKHGTFKINDYWAAEIKKKRGQGVRLAKVLRGQIADLKSNIENLHSRLINLEETEREKDTRIETLKRELNGLAHAKVVADYSANAFFIEEVPGGQNKKFKICPSCNSKNVLPSNRATAIVCHNCSTLVWQK